MRERGSGSRGPAIEEGDPRVSGGTAKKLGGRYHHALMFSTGNLLSLRGSAAPTSEMKCAVYEQCLVLDSAVRIRQVSPGATA